MCYQYNWDSIGYAAMSDSEMCNEYWYKDCNEANALLRNDLKPNRGVINMINMNSLK